MSEETCPHGYPYGVEHGGRLADGRIWDCWNGEVTIRRPAHFLPSRPFRPWHRLLRWVGRG